MSLDAMADDFVTRKSRSRFANLKLVQRSPTTTESLKSAEAQDSAGNSATADNGTSKFMSELTRYIPTEVLSAYIAVIALPPRASAAAADGVSASSAHPYDGFLWGVFVVCLLLCPAAVYVLARSKTNGIGTPAASTPIFPMAASMVAFVLWAAVLPDSVISHQWPALGAWAGFAGVILGTVILSLLNVYLNNQSAQAPAAGAAGGLPQ